MTIKEFREVKKYLDLGLSIAKASAKLGVREYVVGRIRNMTEEDFFNRELTPTEYIDRYKDFIMDILRVTPTTKDTNVLFRLKEEFPNFDCKRVTFFRYMKKLRTENGYDEFVNKSKSRRSREATLPGYETQADFGQFNIKDMYGKRRKVYFFVMVLSYSIMRFCYFSSKPFTTQEAIVGHKYAFKYFNGIPETILYDLDKVFVVSENYGNIILVKDFENFARDMKYVVMLCKGADPQTKGRVEATVLFIKEYFLKGRIYSGIDALNSSCLEWLDNYANEKPYHLTGKTPREMFVNERDKLHKIPYKLEINQTFYAVYTNSITYKLSKYLMPLGYEGKRVLVQETEDSLIIKDPQTDKVICSHNLSKKKGEIVKLKDEKVAVAVTDNLIKMQFGDDKCAMKFFENLKTHKQRYYYRTCTRILTISKTYTKKEMIEAMEYVNKVNSYTLTELIGFLIYRFGEEISKKYLYQSERSFYFKRALEIRRELNG